MSDDIEKRLISRIGNKGKRPSRPCAVTLEPEVRTPIGFIPVSPVEDKDRLDLPSIKSDSTSKSDSTGRRLLGPFLFQWRYNVRYEDVHAFHDWLASYEQRLQELCPWHFSYLGTYAGALGSSSQTGVGQYCTLWQHAHHGGVLHLRYGAQEKEDLTIKLGSDENFRRHENEYLRLLRELMSFQDEASLVRESQLYQLATNIGRV